MLIGLVLCSDGCEIHVLYSILGLKTLHFKLQAWVRVEGVGNGYC